MTEFNLNKYATQRDLYNEPSLETEPEYEPFLFVHDMVSHLRHIVAPCIFFLTCTFWSHLHFFLVVRIVLWYHSNIN